MSPDFIVVNKGAESVEIFKGKNTVTDIEISDTIILVKLYKPERAVIYTKFFFKDLFGYKIIFDSSATYDAYIRTPDGIKQ